MNNKNRACMTLLASLTASVSTFAQDYIAPPMANIPAGQFLMGDVGGDPATLPIHSVTIDAFQMGKYAVTIAEFKKFAKDTGFTKDTTCNDFIDGEGLRGPTHLGSGKWDKHRFYYSDFQPVTCITLDDANAYADWLSEKTGIRYRLPTEQEWEYATKANTTSRFFWGDDHNMTQACSYGNFADLTGEHVNNREYGLSNVGFIEHANCDDGEAYNAIVGLYRPNPFGLFDMVGNVAQLLNSCYSSNGYKVDTEKENDINSCEFTSTRGSTWHYPPQPRSTRGRTKAQGWNVSAGVGFRLATDGHTDDVFESTQKFEAELSQAKAERITQRERLLRAPNKAFVVRLNNGEFELNWQPSDDPTVIGYDIYQSTTPLAHFYAGFYKKHYEKVHTVPANVHQAKVNVPEKGGSFRVVSKSTSQTSLPSEKAIYFPKPSSSVVPGHIQMNEIAALENAPLYHLKATDQKPERFLVFKTNKNSEKSQSTITFNVNVKESAWYQVNYSGNSFQKGDFFTLWQGNRLAGKIDYNPDIDDKTSTRHHVFLEQGMHQLQLSVHREAFDRWGLSWLKFSEIES